MGDSIQNFLAKLSSKERNSIHAILKDIHAGKRHNSYDTTPLKGQKHHYRFRKGKIRIVFYSHGDTTTIIAIDRRGNIY